MRRCASSRRLPGRGDALRDVSSPTDGGLTYSAPADVDGGASALETAIEQAISRMAHATDLTDGHNCK